MPPTITLYDGKYTIIVNELKLTFLRHHEPWPAADEQLAYTNVVRAMAERILELESQLNDKPQ